MLSELDCFILLPIKMGGAGFNAALIPLCLGQVASTLEDSKSMTLVPESTPRR